MIGARQNYGHTITGVVELALPQDGQERSRQEEDRVYGYALTTERGTITLAFRNSSNGYYGGYCYASKSPPPVEFTPITGYDWRA